MVGAKPETRIGFAFLASRMHISLYIIARIDTENSPPPRARPLCAPCAAPRDAPPRAPRLQYPLGYFEGDFNA